MEIPNELVDAIAAHFVRTSPEVQLFLELDKAVQADRARKNEAAILAAGMAEREDGAEDSKP